MKTLLKFACVLFVEQCKSPKVNELFLVSVASQGNCYRSLFVVYFEFDKDTLRNAMSRVAACFLPKTRQLATTQLLMDI